MRKLQLVRLLCAGNECSVQRCHRWSMSFEPLSAFVWSPEAKQAYLGTEAQASVWLAVYNLVTEGIRGNCEGIGCPGECVRRSGVSASTGISMPHALVSDGGVAANSFEPPGAYSYCAAKKKVAGRIGRSVEHTTAIFLPD